ncbi:lateral signaling target protein 2 homolog [Lampris incognitus]|uniref:lateral signaling target protein 2 homolog n=1 Tax=Lampris incognitus TaxID=2546036 RepID=UPI0024B4B47E|nr:lateral signaling target protein 2 homolog [Lampris incognitus]
MFQRPDHLLSQFHCADEERLRAAGELEMLGAQMDDGHCHQMIHQLRSCKVRVLDILNQMMDVCIPGERACRDFWIKFPEEGRHVSLGGSLWFRAESLAACSDQEAEREVMRHLAQDLVSCLDEVCQLAHEQALRDATVYPEILRNGLRRLDRLMAKFEFSYVLAMLPERCSRYRDIHQDLVLLFSQTASRALDQGYINQAMIKDCDPALMVTVPRLAIVCGLLLLPDGALQLDGAAEDVYELFKPFHSLLKTIRC